MPLNQAAREAFRQQTEGSARERVSFSEPQVRSEKNAYDERPQTDHMMTEMLKQEDAEVFTLYSQAKLGIMGEALWLLFMISKGMKY
jgi:hypothetical protein